MVKIFLEPLLKDRQLTAINHLRDQARSAHENGDGLLVNHLCSIALVNLLEWCQKSSIHLRISDIRWVVIFSLYWFTDEYILYTIKELINKYPAVDDCCHKDKDLLSKLLFLSKESLYDCEKEIKQLIDFDFSGLNKDACTENLAYLKLVIELAFIHKPEGPHWLQLVDTLTNNYKLYSQELESLRTRLLIQGSILYPDFPSHSMQANTNLLQPWERELLSLWHTWLNCDWDQFNEIMNNVIIRRNWDGQDAVAIFGLHHTANVFKRERESQFIGLSRRRLLVSGRKGNITSLVDEIRDASYYKEMAQLWQKGSKDKSNLRFDCFRLAMFNEIAALRAWDLLNWIDAIRQNALACQEIIRLLDKDDPGRVDFASSAITNLVLCGSLNEKDELHQELVQLLDFSKKEIQEEVCSKILKTPPRFWYEVISALHLLSDSIPEDLLLQVGNWCIEYFNFPQDRLLGIRHDWWTFWGDILTAVPESHPIFKIIFPIFQAISQSPFMWRLDAKDAILNFIMTAPIEMASDIVDLMFKIDLSGDREANGKRWDIISMAVRRRIEIRERYRDQLIKTADSPLTKLFSEFIDINGIKLIPIDKAETREYIRREIIKRTDNILKRTGKSLGLGMGGIMPHVIEYVTWPEQENDLINKLIEAINSSHITPDEISLFILYLSYLLSVNPDEHFDLIFNNFKTWLLALPEGYDPFTTFK